MIKRMFIIFSFVVLASLQVKGQGYFAFYELRDLVQQTQTLQPAFIPNNSVSVSLPALNFGTSVQADFKMEQLLTKDEQGLFVVDFDVLRESAEESNYTNFNLTANLFTLNIKTFIGAFSMFANSRASFDLVYGKPLLEFLANGNSNAIGSSIDLSDTKLLMNGFNEYGLGYANQFLDNKLTVGARIKMIQGVFHGSLDDAFEGSLHTREEDFFWTMDVKGGQVNTAGLDYLFNSDSYDDSALMNYALSNENKTVAFDFGAKYQALPFLTVEAAVNDIGKIKWTEQVRNYQTEDAVVTYQGIDLKNLGDADNILEDSLLSKFNSSETEIAFESTIGARYYLTLTGNVTPNDRFSLTYFKNSAFSDLPANYALSFNHRFENFVVGAVGSYRRANNEMNLGASLASNIGPFQLYFALDNILVMNKPEQYSKLDFRFGLNLLFGFNKWKKDKVVDLDKL